MRLSALSGVLILIFIATGMIRPVYAQLEPVTPTISPTTQPSLLPVQPSQPSQSNTPPVELTPAETSAPPELSPGVPMLKALPKESPDIKTLMEDPAPIVLKGGLLKTQTVPITLQNIVDQVQKQNMLIEQVRLGAKIQKNTIYRSLSNLAPDVGWTYYQSHFSGGFQIFGNEILNFTQTRINPSMSVTNTWRVGMLFDTWAEQRRWKAQRRLLESTVQEQMVLASQAYYKLIQSMILRENAYQSLKESRAQVKLANAKVQVGVSTKLDLMQAKSSEAQQQRVVIDAENALGQAEQQLLTLLNLDTNIHLQASDIDMSTNLERNLVPDALDLNQLKDKALKIHPDICQLDFELKALNAEMASRVSDIIPSFNVAYTSGYLGPQWDSLSRQKQTAITVSTALTENSGFAFPLDIRRKFLEIQQKKAQRQVMVRQVEQNIANTSLNSQAQHEAIRAAGQELAAAQESYRLATGRYQAGVGIFLDVLNAQTTLSNARSNLVTTILAYDSAQLDLLQALGQVSADHIMNGLKANDALLTK